MANFEILHMIILKRTCEMKFVLKKKNMSNLTQKRCIKESKKTTYKYLMELFIIE